MSTQAVKLAVLVSGSGTTLQNLIDRIESGTLDAKIKLVIASRPGIVGIERAKNNNLSFAAIDRRTFADVPSFSKKVFAAIDEGDVDLVCLAGWLCLLDIPAGFSGRVMNIHPALLPSFGGQGMFGHRVHQAVLDHGCKVSGCTVHFVDQVYDAGPIILQRTCAVAENDTAATLASRVFEQEKIAYPDAIQLFAAGRLKIQGRRVHVLD